MGIDFSTLRGKDLEFFKAQGILNSSRQKDPEFFKA